MTDDKYKNELLQMIFVLSPEQKRQKEINKENGNIVDSIDDLVCKEHPDAKFKEVKKIPGGFYNLFIEDSEGFNIYQCESCIAEKKVIKSEAYDCPKCGIVVSHLIKRSYCTSKESWSILQGKEGDNYFCRLCGLLLGDDCKVVS